MDRLPPNILGTIALESVGRLQGYRAASQELGLTVAGVTRRIQRLEGQLGCALVVRQAQDGRRRELSSEGRVLVEAMRPIHEWALGMVRAAEATEAHDLVHHENRVLKELLAEFTVAQALRERSCREGSKLQRDTFKK